MIGAGIEGMVGFRKVRKGRIMEIEREKCYKKSRSMRTEKNKIIYYYLFIANLEW